jgi:hypothetical protein
MVAVSFIDWFSCSQNIKIVRLSNLSIWAYLNATFNNISVLWWRSVLLVEETSVPGENHWPVASNWQTLSPNVVSSTPRHEQGFNSQLQKTHDLPHYLNMYTDHNNQLTGFFCILPDINCNRTHIKWSLPLFIFLHKRALIMKIYMQFSCEK